MKKRYKKELSPEDFVAMRDKDIDFSDVPEVDRNWFKKAKLIGPEGTIPITLRVKTSVVEAFKAQGKGYQTRMKVVLETYARSELIKK